MREGIKALDTSIEFYGRVLDQNDRPVVDAEVVVNVESFDPFSEFFVGVRPHQVETDFEGRFELTGCRGSGIFVDKISAEGYEFKYSENRKRSFEFNVVGDGKKSRIFIPDKDKPVVFRLRKKHLNRTFVFEKPMWAIQVLEEESGMLKGTDFIEGRWSRMPGEKPRDSRSEHCDLFFRAVYNKQTEKWQVDLKPGGPNGGILVSDQLLFVAPDENYEAGWSFVPVGHKVPHRKYIYIRSRSPAIFSRIEMTYVNANERFFRLSGKVATNPYGDRVLDSVDMDSLTNHQQFVLQERLKSEAQEALRQGRLPERPKIMALIEAAKRGGE